MLKHYYPAARVGGVFDLDWDKLYALGYRGLLLDVDGTLVPHGADSTPEVDALFADMARAGLAPMVFSNNNVPRLTRFLAHIDAPYLDHAGKPAPGRYREAAERLGLPCEQVLVIGDQVFTDILGANRAGMDSILVAYLTHPGETKLGLRRRLERVILWFYRHNKSCRDRLGCVEKEARCGKETAVL